MAIVASLPESKSRPEIVTGPPILAEVVDRVIDGRVAGDALGVDEGIGEGSALVTWSSVSTGQEPFQQICTM
jgi:hypothetical protein